MLVKFVIKHKFFFVIISFALVLRLLLITSAHHGDLNNNISWGKIAFERGYSGFYDDSKSENWPYSAPNQPPLTIHLFRFNFAEWNLLSNMFTYLNDSIGIFPSKFIWFWELNGIDIVFKLPSILFDVGIGVIIYFFVAKKLNSKAAIFASSFWFFNPISWYNSSTWGQTDSIVNFLGLVAIIMLVERRFILFCFWFSLSFLFKGSLGVHILPLTYIVFIQKYDVKTLIKGMGMALATIFIVGIWFHPRADYYLWITDLYRNRILPGEIGSLSANAFNFWWLVDRGETLDSKLFLGLTARVWGIIAYIFISTLLIYKTKSKLLLNNNIWIFLSLISFAAFLFMTRIHPRYLYPVFPVLTIYAGLNNRYFKILALLSLFHFLNIYYLFWVPGIDSLKNLYTPSGFTSALAVVALALFLYLSRSYVKTENS